MRCRRRRFRRKGLKQFGFRRKFRAYRSRFGRRFRMRGKRISYRFVRRPRRVGRRL